jgi:pimeloyl-ACP methyl ester carboxylesterase
MPSDDSDRAAISGEFAEHLSRTLREGLSNGIWGWFDDDIAFISDWGFDLRSIERPLTIWHGVQDRPVPPSHGRWPVDHISGARAQVRAEHGHLSLQIGAYSDISTICSRPARLRYHSEARTSLDADSSHRTPHWEMMRRPHRSTEETADGTDPAGHATDTPFHLRSG